jgi:tRNA threonylcarbamoyladenosine biosynthesis protein TsaB
MIILSIDTCGLYYSVAILQDSNCLYQIKSCEKNMQCEELILKIESLLAKVNLNYENLDLIVVTSGPGTFNGVRIGISAANGIALARNIKIVTVSTVAVMAYNLKSSSICFTPDGQIGFLQEFDSNFQPLSQVVQVDLNNVGENTAIFDINSYDLLSNGLVPALVYLRSGEISPIFYGKPPSIHIK